MSKDFKNDLCVKKIYSSYNDNQNKKEICKNLNLIRDAFYIVMEKEN